MKETPWCVSSVKTNDAVFSDCEVNGKSVTALVDTGAAVTLIHRDIFNKCRHANTRTRKPTRAIVGANNTPLAIACIAEVEIELGGIRIVHDVQVCEDLAQDMLVGTDILKNNQVIIDFGSGTISANGKESLLTSRPSKEVYRVTVAESITIPPRTMINMYGKVDGGSAANEVTGVLEPEIRFEERYSTGILKVAATVRDGKVPIRVFNPQSKPQRVYRGSTVGELHTLSENDETPYKVIQDELEPEHIATCFMTATQNRHETLKEEIKSLFTVDNPLIPEEEKNHVYDILTRHTRAISRGSHDLGELTTVRHTIDTGNSPPIRIPPRRLAFHSRNAVREEVKTMLEGDIIEPSSSPWSSPVVLVAKKDGTRRFCVDYRKLNAVTRKDVYPLPRCEDILHTLSGAAYFTHLDLVRGYWQIGVDEEDREKTAFSTVDGHYQFKRMPFGLTNAPATFQRAMHTVLHGLNWLDCLVYLDDIVIFASTLSEHHRKLDTVLQRLEENGLKLNAKKCHVLQNQTTLLGHVVSRDGVSTDPEKVEVLKSWPIPHDLTGLRSFLGVVGYYRQFIPHFADIAAPLYKLEQKSTAYTWTEDCNRAFETLKKKLTTAPVLAYPRFDLHFTVDTDASNVGLGAVLSQVQDGEERVIAYAARSLSKTERNYSTTRKELLAVVWALEHFDAYLLGKQFVVRTDHSALRWLQNFKNPKGQMARWLERLSEFNFTIQHRPGKQHGNADGLSRITPNQDFEEEDEVALANTVQEEWRCTLSDIKQKQREDSNIQRAIGWVEAGQRPDREEIAQEGPLCGSLWSQFRRLKLFGECLYREFESKDGRTLTSQLVIPQSMVAEILKALHDLPSSGHLGVNKMSEKVQRRYYWKGWRQDVEDYCRQCEKCARHNAPVGRRARAPLTTSSPGQSMERVAIDIMGPFPTTPQGNRYILVVCDYFTKWPEAYAVPDHKATTVADKLVKEWVSRYGMMQTLHSDQGPEFESDVFQSLLAMLGITKTRTTPYHPQSDGLVERFNRTLVSMLAKTVDENQRGWDSWIPQTLLAYRTATHASTGVTPFRLMFGKEARLPVDVLLEEEPPETKSESIPEYVSNQKLKFQAAFKKARDNTKVATQRYKDYYDAGASEGTFEVGDRVWRYLHISKKGLSKKLSARWDGPYIIIKKISDVVFRLRKEKGRKRVVVHFNSLKKCYSSRKSRANSRQTEQASQNQVPQNETSHIQPQNQVPRQQVRQNQVPQDETSHVHPETPSNHYDEESDEEWVLFQPITSRASEQTGLPPLVQQDQDSNPNLNTEDAMSSPGPQCGQDTDQSRADDPELQSDQSRTQSSNIEGERPSYASVVRRPPPQPSHGDSHIDVEISEGTGPKSYPSRTRRPPVWARDYVVNHIKNSAGAK